MKKYTLYKTVQLVLVIAVAAVVVCWIFPNSGVYHQVSTDPTTRLVTMVCWMLLILSFLFILLDFSFFFKYLKEYREMETAARSDPESGINNRFSCDMYIEKYLDKPIPENMACIMIDITNIAEINKAFGHLQGNTTICDFANILRLSATEKCFVGRNGGNKFLVIFEDASSDDLLRFLERVNQRVSAHNREYKNSPIEFEYGSAHHESGITDITSLISLANSRIPKREAYPDA